PTRDAFKPVHAVWSPTLPRPSPAVAVDTTRGAPSATEPRTLYLKEDEARRHTTPNGQEAADQGEVVWGARPTAHGCVAGLPRDPAGTERADRKRRATGRRHDATRGSMARGTVRVAVG